MKEYRIDAKIRNNLILKKIEETGCKTVGEFCNKYNFSPSQLGNLINLKDKAIRDNMEWRILVIRLCEIFYCDPEDIITEEQKCMELKNNRRTIEMGMAELEYSTKVNLLLEDKSRPEVSCEKEEIKEILEKGMAILTGRQRKVVEMRIMDEMTYEEIANYFGLTRERIRQIESKSLKRIRRNLGDDITNVL